MAPLIHLQILISKLDTISDADFHKYWSESHPKIWLGVKLVQENIVKYSQFHVDRKATQAVEAMGVPCVTYDGGADMWAKSLEDLMAVFQDEEYKRLVVPDEESFLKRSEAKMMIGYDEQKEWSDGKVVSS
ncbi:MAG: hypothetical protein CYPHOPRED_001279 [Cyphobasidiales sp. Tagirdzhanova-0007]|nr:MAG: hypothetical protein CYPHOPRED_001279 [Cyphobasidiales sp. Tagirdzhanova-0007]